MSEPPDYTQKPFFTEVHNERSRSNTFTGLSQDQQSSLRGKLIESIISIVVQAITGSFIPGGGIGGAFTQLQQWATDLLTSIPVLGPFFAWLAGLFGIDIGDVGEADSDSVWTSIIQNFLNPLGLLTQVGVPAIQNIIDQFFDAINNNESGTSSGISLSTVFDMVGQLLGVGARAAAQNSIQDAQIATLLNGGTFLLACNFDGPAGALPSGDFDLTQIDSGGGAPELSGSGTLEWDRSGGVVSGWYVRYKVAECATDVNLVTWTLMSNTAYNHQNNPWTAGTCWGNDTNDSYVWGKVFEDSVEIGYTLAGVETILDSADYDEDTTGTWKLKLGTTTDDRQFILVHNESPVLTATDTLDACYKPSVGGDGNFIGVIMTCGRKIIPIFPFPTEQVKCPDIGSLGATDRDITS